MEGIFLPQSSSLPGWRIICLQWIIELIRFCEMINYQDAIHDQQERTNAGILAIAAAKSGYGVLPEGYLSRGDRGGYLDMCFIDPNRNESTLIECKWAQGNGASVIGAAKTQLREACAQVLSVGNSPVITTTKSQNIVKAGVVFACPFFQPGLPWQQMEAELSTTVRTLQENPFFDVMAWCFAEQLSVAVRRFQSIYPGVFMLCQKAEMPSTGFQGNAQ